MKTLIGIIIGILCCCCTGFTYNLPNGFRDNPNLRVDVRLVEINKHEYVVSSMSAGAADGGCAICTIHHVGCKACNLKP